MTGWIKTIGSMHGRFVHIRRIERLAEAIAPLIAPGWSVADVGCGDGVLAARVADQVGGVSVRGFEIAPRPDTAIPVEPFDGKRLPLDDNAVDAVMLVDVLHHTDDPNVLIAEAARVAKQAVIIKDHRTSRPAARLTLRLMDWIGNKPHHVALPYHYWSMAQWRQGWARAGLHVAGQQTRLGLYPWPASWLFERGLHLLVKLRLTPPSTDGSIAAWERAYRRFESPAQERAKFRRRLRQLGVDGWDRSLRVVELFCGRGNGLHAWSDLGFKRVEGLDRSEALVLAYEGGARCTVGDARCLPYADASFDVVAIQGGLHHLTLMDDLDATLREIHRVLKPGGRVLLVEPWLTPFLRLVHGMCGVRWLRRLWPRLDALATMIEHERRTYEDWLSRAEEITAALERVLIAQRRRVGWGKLMFIGTRRQ